MDNVSDLGSEGQVKGCRRRSANGRAREWSRSMQANEVARSSGVDSGSQKSSDASKPYKRTWTRRKSRQFSLAASLMQWVGDKERGKKSAGSSYLEIQPTPAPGVAYHTA
eukprot:2943341-Pleurochrysis_carterae.AAC.2